MTLPTGPVKLLAVEVIEDAPTSESLLCEAQAGDDQPDDGGRIEIELPKGRCVRMCLTSGGYKVPGDPRLMTRLMSLR